MERHRSELADFYDVVVVGAGPAGAAAARGLAGQGLKVLLAERARLPRYKMCSGVLSPTAVKYVADHFGELPAAIVAAPPEVYGAKVYTSIGGPVVDVRFSEVDQGPGLPELALSVDRGAFDHWLATSSGAELRDGCGFKSVRGVGGRLSITLDQDGEERTVAAGYLVGADGAMSRVRRALAPEFDRGLRRIPNYEEWYRGRIDLEPRWLNVFLDERLTTFFASIFHKDDKIAVVTGARHPEPVKGYFRALVEHLQKHHGLVIEETLSTCGCVLHDMSATDNFHLGAANALLIGEAGGFSRALGEGISSALVTGKAAADAILESRRTGRWALDAYRERAAPEVDLCNGLNRMLKQELGLNPFTR